MAKQERRTIKATFSLGVDLVARVNACATLRNQSRDALVTAALEEAVKGLVLFDRRKGAGRSGVSDRLELESGVNPTGEELPHDGPGLTVVPDARSAVGGRRAG